MKPLHLALIFGTVIAWGFNFVASRVALEIFSPEQMAFARSALTLALLLPWWRPLQRLPWRLLAAALAIGTFSFYLVYEAIRLTESLTAVAVATQLMPSLSALLALVFFREPISARKWLGILIATAGAVFLAGATKSSLSAAAMGLTVLGVLFYSAGSVTIGKTAAVGLWNILAWIAAVSLLPLAFMAALSGPLLPDLGQMQPRHALAFLFSVVIAGLMGQAALFHLYRNHRVSDVAPWTLFVPVIAAVSSIAVYDEKVTIGLVTGAAIVLLGVWIQQGGFARSN